jgi:GNAT superfamily N-acetyltransferase
MTLTIRRAGPDDVPAVLGLVTEAATWLAQRSSAQWQHPIEKLHRGIARDTARGEVWVVEADAGTAIATITITTTQTPSSGPRRPPRRRLYARRMVVTRAHAGQEIGSALLAWAAQRVSTAGKRWLRLDAWSGNAELHK